MLNTSYIIVTPARNEGKNLPKLIESVANQSLKPSLYVIVDDNSEDNTISIIQSYNKKYKWIQYVHIDQRDEYMGVHYSEVCIIGFDFAINYCKKNKIEYKYIGLLDADIILQKDYFECIIDKFEKDTSLGIASGNTWSDANGKLIKSHQRGDLPSGAARIWRNECFEQTGGYLKTHAPDSVSNVKAKLLGWKTKRFNKYKVIQTRRTGSGQSLWKGRKSQGEREYFLNKHPLLAFGTFLDFLLQHPYYPAFAFAWAYMISFLKRKEQISDEEIKKYFWNTRLNEYKKIYIQWIKSKLTTSKNSK